MKVTNTILTKIAETSTENAFYRIEYNITNAELERVQATVCLPGGDSTEAIAGDIYYDRGSVSLSMPFSEKIALYLSDFLGIVGDILGSLDREIAEATLKPVPEAE